jgi:hypothetical protein
MRVLLLGLVLVTAIGGCGSENGTTTVTERQTTTVIREAPDEPDARPPASPEDAGDSAPDPDQETSGGDIVVPDVVGEDHQLAQDTMQSAGLYNLSEEDATGQDRLMLIDRNWEVVEQEPAAGTHVNEDATIILRSKKDDE